MKNNYSIGEIIKNILAVVYTKLFFRGARLIRRPFYIRGQTFFSYQQGLTVGYNCRFEMFNLDNKATKKLIIGTNCKMGDNVHIAAGESVKIGNNCLFASKIYISDITHGDYLSEIGASNPNSPPDERSLKTNKVEIGNNVWLGENVCVLPGVKIGNGAIIGANAVVNKDIPMNCIAVGAPAKVVKIYDDIEQKWMKV